MQLKAARITRRRHKAIFSNSCIFGPKCPHAAQPVICDAAPYPGHRLNESMDVGTLVPMIVANKTLIKPTPTIPTTFLFVRCLYGSACVSQRFHAIVANMSQLLHSHDARS